jgi:serine/threonine-protein kinase
VWSLGVILFECLAGTRPFEGENLGQILKKVMVGGAPKLGARAPSVPEPVARLVDRMLSVERSGRPQDLREVLELLRPYTDRSVQSFGTALPVKNVIVTGSGATDPFSKTTLPTRRRRMAWLAAAVSLTAALSGAAAWRLARRAPKAAAASAVQAPASAVQAPASAVRAPASAVQAPASAVQQAPPSTAQAPPSRAEAAEGAASPARHNRRRAAPEHKMPGALPGGVVGQVPF